LTRTVVARIDEHCRLLALELDQVAEACEQLAPERARSRRNAITMASVMLDEIRLRPMPDRSTRRASERALRDRTSDPQAVRVADRF
jgi:hypothetical protein